MAEWYAQPVAYLASNGILKGYLDGTFRPDANITRAELATMLSRFENLRETSASAFPDVVGHWAEKSVNSAAAKGWVSGYPDGTFKPENNITRAETVAVVNRMLERTVLKEDLPGWAPRYADLLDSHWAYADIIEASAEHKFERKESGYEIWYR